MQHTCWVVYFFGNRNEARSRTVCRRAHGGMSSDFLYVNKTSKPLHTQVGMKGLEDQEGKEGEIKVGGNRHLKKTCGMKEREAIIKPNTVGV